MKARTPYMITSIALLFTEILIATFVHDRFIRPYIGDVLVTVLLCCVVRIVYPEKPRLLAIWVFLFSVVIELFQLLGLARLLGVEGTVLGIILGSTFDWMDLLCYFCGCLIFYLGERCVIKRAAAIESNL